ncbi:M23 family metallopeptidase [Candidatus Marinimicrobia bacterium]|jgi:murein DD-endopeptidase MepM/ murein hydrolase activator NlpD|nr:M23 family metallopeptidase [Candidatus Neomarinimicrobiota bacterium]MBT3944663.1 M23 family metallopeptidase [Candidatus Neomarinimicrobiota bacterium]MBT6188305.1 M23 family metallopeptidase [Candidatus Neomarinimicrobiota bacterium]MBT6839577.1 M23 family metallopeptidase [Candidatus Neomarinimicrobiota bacterium]MBT6867936.1 M23 family metallopeptidase [Candidatus Neomarinimicrobiota bacterium]
MKFKKYKILFISPFNDKTWQSEFNRPTLIAGLSLISFLFIASLSLMLLSIPIVKEYLKITAINKEIKQQEKIIDNISGTLDEIGLMKSYIENIIGSDSQSKLSDNNIRFMVTNNIPDIQPTDGIISKDFDLNTLHFGIDIVSDESTPIVSIADGVVIYSDYSKELGNGIVIDHQNGYQSHYYHNEENFVKKNEEIDRGMLIGKIGNTGVSTGPHLHFEIWKDGEPIDPLKFFPNFSKKSDKFQEESNE